MRNRICTHHRRDTSVKIKVHQLAGTRMEMEFSAAPEPPSGSEGVAPPVAPRGAGLRPQAPPS